MGATTITKRILDLEINLTVDKLLAFALAVKKQLTKAISKNEAIQFQVNTLSSAAVFEASISYSWWFMGLQKAKVRLENSFKFTALLNTGAKINIITRKLMEEANLAMKKRLKLELVLYTSYSQPFLRPCKDIKVAIKELKTRHPIFVVKTGDHKLVLGQPFLNSVKFN